jgi:hypothetical protein
MQAKPADVGQALRYKAPVKLRSHLLLNKEASNLEASSFPINLFNPPKSWF